uniref:Uncharacterized protein n=1 Tax=Trichogramma kaykai TaxID=54128 RepID=A0ABD2VSE2_9HYME
MEKSYLELYVEEASEVYKPEFVSLNVDYLNHLVDDLYKQKYLSIKHPDNTILLKNKKIVKILEFVKIDDEVFLRVVDNRRKSVVYEFPCESSMLYTYAIFDQVKDSTGRQINLDDIKFELVELTIGC